MSHEVGLEEGSQSPEVQQRLYVGRWVYWRGTLFLSAAERFLALHSHANFVLRW